jgi:ferric-dicitrate binding protein FerR (iron transport regulator)
MKTPSQAKSEDGTVDDEAKRAKNREAAARYRERNREKFNQRMRDWRAANREKSREHAREWRNRKIANGTPEEVAAIRAAESEKTKRNQDRRRDEVFAAYGGYRCACCAETERMFLSIDHINNDGNVERKSGAYRSSGTAFYLWLCKQGFPRGYQVLCMNCQVGKHKNGGVCPHQRKV